MGEIALHRIKKSMIHGLFFVHIWEEHHIKRKETEKMNITEKSITLCGHGSGTPSTKNMYTYLNTRYNSIASNGKRKCIVKVMRLKALTDADRKTFHDTYKTILGRNIYSQALRSYVYTSKSGKYYSDCSSSGMATFKKIGYNVSLLNTAGIYQSSLFSEVPVNITNGHISNPEILKVGDALLFVGNDASRPLQIGHVEFVYEINGISNTISDTAAVTATNTVTATKDSNAVSSSYSRKDFIKDVQSVINAKVDGIAGPETLSKTITVSQYKNRKHAVVKPIQTYLNSLGYSCGTVDGIAGPKFDAAVKSYQRVKSCIVDGEITAGKNTWRSLLGLR